MKTIKNLGKKLSLARQFTYLSFTMLFLAILVGGLSSGTPAFILLVALFPLAIFIPTLVKESYKGLSLICFVTLMYFLVTVVNLFSPDASIYDWVALIAQVLLFNAAMLFSRWKQYSLYQDVN